ncbi:hypothetical protein NQZ68_000822 [Dissostichus eleginoides]|nr:hypothetical protein NQZ68_000822 [Dissostichus eleginoides]
MSQRAAIDVVHRIGRPKDGGSNNTMRPVIIRFLSRMTRVLWRGSKKNGYLKNNRLNFKEDLTSAARDTRRRLWTVVEAARQKGDKAYFVGNKPFINGIEI